MILNICTNLSWLIWMASLLTFHLIHDPNCKCVCNCLLQVIAKRGRILLLVMDFFYNLSAQVTTNIFQFIHDFSHPPLLNGDCLFLSLENYCYKTFSVGIMEFQVYTTGCCEDWPRRHILSHKVTRDVYFPFSSSERWRFSYSYWALSVCQPLYQEFCMPHLAQPPNLMRQLLTLFDEVQRV